MVNLDGSLYVNENKIHAVFTTISSYGERLTTFLIEGKQNYSRFIPRCLILKIKLNIWYW